MLSYKLQTTLYEKSTDRQTHLPAKSEHPRSVKESTAYSQALRRTRIFSTNFAFEVHINIIKGQCVKHGYEKTLIENQIERVVKLNSNSLLVEQNKSKTPLCLPLSVT